MRPRPLDSQTPSSSVEALELQGKIVDAAIDQVAFKRYLHGLRRCMQQKGYGLLASSREQSLFPNSCFLFVLLNADGHMHGGIRVQVHDARAPIPSVRVLRHLVPKAASRIEASAEEGGCGELCGIWLDPVLSGRGLAMALTEYACSHAVEISGRWLWGICPDLLLEGYQRVGFRVPPIAEVRDGFHYRDAREHAWLIRRDNFDMAPTKRSDIGLGEAAETARSGLIRVGGHRGSASIRFDVEGR